MPEKKCRNMVTVEGKSYPKCGNNYAMESQMACHSCIFGSEEEYNHGNCPECERPVAECTCWINAEVPGNCPACDGTGVDGFGCMCEWCRGTKNK